MKKFIAIFRNLEIDVYAETREEARKIALSGFAAQVESEMTLREAPAKTERCDICQYTFAPSEIVRENGEKLCWFCHFDKYRFEEQNLNDIDIPF